jgi:ATP-dependent Clp protease ATP-binding subunit ClpC
MEHDVSAYSPETVELLRLARDEARRLGHEYIGTEHLLLAFAHEDGPSTSILERLAIDPDHVRAHVESVVRRGSASVELVEDRPLTRHTQTALRIAKEFAHSRGDSAVSPSHILVGLLKDNLNVAAQVLIDAGTSTSDAIAALWPESKSPT